MEVDFNYLLNNNINFSFIKFGDGEIICMDNKFMDFDTNCDNHPYSKELSELLIKSLSYYSDKQNVYIGKWEDERFEFIFDRIVENNKLSLNYVDFEIFLHSNTNKNIESTVNFYNTLRNKDLKKLYVCNSSLIGVKDLLNCDILEVDEINAFLKYEYTKGKLLDLIDKYDVFLYSAGFISKVLIMDAMLLNKNKTHIDIGSGFDSFCGKITRANQLNEGVLKLLYKRI